MSSLMDYAQAAEWLQVPEGWLRQRVQKGWAPHTRLGKHVRFTEAHLQAMVKAGEPKLALGVMPIDTATLRPGKKK